VFGKKAGSVINLKFVFSLLILGLTKVLGLFNRFFAKPQNVTGNTT
jgi:hypothetical protein